MSFSTSVQNFFCYVLELFFKHDKFLVVEYEVEDVESPSSGSKGFTQSRYCIKVLNIDTI